MTTQKVHLSVPVDPSGQGSTFGPLENTAPLGGSRLNNGGAAIFVIPVSDAGGFLDTPLMLNDNTDGVAPVDSPRYLGDVARLTAYNGASFDRLRADNTGADGISGTLGSLSVASKLLGLSGAGTFSRIRIADAAFVSQLATAGALAVAEPGTWSIVHFPAANTQATVTRAAGGAGVRHVCQGISASTTGAGTDNLTVRLRDGATGAGTILWECYVPRNPTLPYNAINVTGLRIVGSPNTAMTLEFSGATSGNGFAGVALTGFDAS